MLYASRKVVGSYVVIEVRTNAKDNDISIRVSSGKCRIVEQWRKVATYDERSSSEVLAVSVKRCAIVELVGKKSHAVGRPGGNQEHTTRRLAFPAAGDRMPGHGVDVLEEAR